MASKTGKNVPIELQCKVLSYIAEKLKQQKFSTILIQKKFQNICRYMEEALDYDDYENVTSEFKKDIMDMKTAQQLSCNIGFYGSKVLDDAQKCYSKVKQLEEDLNDLRKGY
uniref:Uncharacterized protein n=1 Tax=Strongyloides stercoralis TaxID=6248 RepID=A0A0K0ELN2_STRER